MKSIIINILLKYHIKWRSPRDREIVHLYLLGLARVSYRLLRDIAHNNNNYVTHVKPTCNNNTYRKHLYPPPAGSRATEARAGTSTIASCCCSARHARHSPRDKRRRATRNSKYGFCIGSPPRTVVIIFYFLNRTRVLQQVAAAPHDTHDIIPLECTARAFRSTDGPIIILLRFITSYNNIRCLSARCSEIVFKRLLPLLPGWTLLREFVFFVFFFISNASLRPAIFSTTSARSLERS